MRFSQRCNIFIRIYDDVIEEEAKVLDEDLKNGFPLIGLTLKYDYKVGESKYVTITKENIHKKRRNHMRCRTIH